jgi:hypothetical protein
MNETQILEWVQSASTPLLGLLIFGGYKIMQALHAIELRLQKLELKIDEKI